MSPFFELEIIVPEKTYFDDKVNSLSVVTSDGELTILAHHTDLIANIEISHMKINANGKVKYYAVSGGIMNIYQKENKVILCVNAIESQDEIDKDRALRAKENAENKLKQESITLREQQRFEIKLKRALNRLSLTNGK